MRNLSTAWKIYASILGLKLDLCKTGLMSKGKTTISRSHGMICAEPQSLVAPSYIRRILR
jgi:hypothetical protein